MKLVRTLLVCSLFVATLLPSSMVAEGASTIALHVLGCSLEEVNDIYYCIRPNECHSSSKRFRLSRVSILKGGTMQSVRYIGRLKSSGANRKWLYGALEVSSEPLSLKAWKQLGTNSSEALMRVTEVVLKEEQHEDGDGKREGDLEDSFRTFSAVRELTYLRQELGLLGHSQELSRSWSVLERSCLGQRSALCSIAMCDYLVEQESYNLAGDCYQNTELLQSNNLPSVCWLAYPDIVERAAIVTLFRLFDAGSFKRIIDNSLTEDCAKSFPTAARRLAALLSLGQLLLGHYNEMQLNAAGEREIQRVFSADTLSAPSSENAQSVSVESMILSCARSRSIVRHTQINVLLDHAEVLLREAQQNVARLQLDWEFSSAILSSFLSVGASHLAVHHFLSLLTTTPSSPQVASYDICGESPSCDQCSLNVRALSCLSAGWFQALSLDQSLHYLSRDSVALMFLRLIMEVANPVVLQSSYLNWMEEVHFLKTEGMRLLTSVHDECNRIHCLWPPNIMATVGRGLFMQAYQGGQLLWPFLRSDDLLDWKAGSMILAMNRGVHERNGVFSNVHPSASSLEDARLRVAFIAFSFTRHSVGRLLIKLICSLRAHDIDVVVATDRGCGRPEPLDDVSLQLQSCISPENLICFTANSSPVELQRQLAQLGVSAIVFSDLAMQPPLLAWVHNIRLAPLQIVFWGHPFTTSDFNAIDYFITSAGFEPDSVSLARDLHFSEQLVQFDTLSFALADPEPIDQQRINDAVSSSGTIDAIFQWLCDHGISLQGKVYSHSYLEDLERNCSRGGDSIKLYGVLQSMMKLHPAFDQAIHRILQLDPCGIVVITRNDVQWEWLRRLQYRLASTLAAASNRVVMVEQVPHKTYAHILCKLHVSVDPFPFGGGVTLCDALSCGCTASMTGKDRQEGSSYPTPIVSVGDVQTVHRIGSGILSTVNDADLGSIVHCPEIARVMKLHDKEPQNLAQYINIFNSAMGNCTDKVATQAFQLAKMARVRKLGSDREALHTKCSRAATLFNADAISKEWSRFLHRAWKTIAMQTS